MKTVSTSRRALMVTMLVAGGLAFAAGGALALAKVGNSSVPATEPTPSIAAADSVGDTLAALQSHARAVAGSISDGRTVSTFEWGETTASRAVILTDPQGVQLDEAHRDLPVYVIGLRGDFAYAGEGFVSPIKSVVVVVDPETLGIQTVAYRGGEVDTSSVGEFKVEAL